jgi:hypothetical protein
MSRVFSGDSFQHWLFIKKDDTNHTADDGVRRYYLVEDGLII